jgi:hypothetical protein
MSSESPSQPSLPTDIIGAARTVFPRDSDGKVRVLVENILGDASRETVSDVTE